jgi:hypothetical protein
MGEVIAIVIIVFLAAWGLSMIARKLREASGSTDAAATSRAIGRPGAANVWRFIILAALAAAAYWHWKAS